MSLVQIHCGIIKLPTNREDGGGDPGFVGGIPPDDRSKTPRDRGRRESPDETESSGGSYCDDNPNSEGCICIRNPQSPRCGRRDSDNGETASQAHRRLRDRYNTWVELDDVSKSIAEEFLSGATINYDLEYVRAYFDLRKQATDTADTYGGKIQILVVLEGPSGEEPPFREGLPFHAGSGNEPRYNVWSKNFGGYEGKLGFHGFFEDMRHGSVILVVKDVERMSGESNEIISKGSIWFMRFKSHDGNNHRDCYRGGRYIGLGGVGLPRHPTKKCWEVAGTPFDCRAWKGRGTQVNTLASLEPGNCYRKLGNFGRARSDALDVKGAFDLTGEESFLQGL